MPCCILRVDGPEFDPDEFLATSDLVADTIYRRGELRRGDAIHTTGGFTASVSEADDHGRQVQDAIAYLRDHSGALERLRDQPGVTVMLDFGDDFPADKLMGRYYRLPLALIELCASTGIEIELSVYVTR